MIDQSGKLTFSPNETLLREGESGGWAYLITSGKVKIVKGAMTDNPRTIAVVGKGDVVGEMSLFDDHTHMASVVAVEETQATSISREQFQARLDGMDPVMKGIMKLLTQRIRGMANDMIREKTAIDWGNWRKSS